MNFRARDTCYWLCVLDKVATIATYEVGIVPAQVACTTAEALAELISRLALAESRRPEDYLELQPMLLRIAGADGSRIHSGRSRQDMLATVHRLLLRDRFLVLFRRLTTVRQEMLRLGSTYFNIAVPAYTNGVQAQPVTFGHQISGYEATLQRGAARLKEAYRRLNLSPLGAAALATSSFPLDRTRLAALLGFDGCVENSFDAAQLSVIDVGAEMAFSAAIIALSLGTFIQDLHAQFHHARPWVLLDDDALLSPSTLMPQKRNPVALNRARLLASEVVGDGMTAALAAHNVCSGLTDYKRADAARALERVIALLDEVERILKAIRVDEEAAMAEITAEYSTTSELANILQRAADIPFSIGHHFASALVTFGRQKQLHSKDIPFSDAKSLYRRMAEKENAIVQELPLDEKAFREALDPIVMIDNYRGLGGSQPKEVLRMLADAEAARHADASWLAAIVESLENSEEEMESAFRRILAGGASAADGA